MSTQVGRLRIAYDLWRQYGTQNFGYRLWYAAARRGGLLKRRFPVRDWANQSLGAWLADQSPAIAPASADAYKEFREQTGPRFFFRPDALPALPPEWTAEAIATADDILAGRLRYFSGQTGDLGFPFDWFLNPFTGARSDSTRHWCDRNDFDDREGDVKVYWEPSRFGWVYPLVRAYAATRDDKYARGFWTLLESWTAANPPNMGPNWQCGQECALRSFALCFALYGFAAAPSSTSPRAARLAAIVALHADRIERNVRFAETQMNNHGLSEGVGLYTIGLLFPELAPAPRWRARGMQVIERAAKEHSYADGSYIQHSLNYHRLMLHDYLWAVRLAELNGERFSPRIRETLDRHTQFLYQLQNKENGEVPNYGPNDGALILPLNGCPYGDFRAVVGALHYLLHGQRLYGHGPWEEDLHWLFGGEAASAPRATIERRSSRFDVGGYYTLRGDESWALIRCHTYRHHPYQADMLHLDLWWRGQNILRDSGTYSYNVPEPWKSYFSSTVAHNTIELGGESQMLKQRRFTWVYPTRSQLQQFQPNETIDVDYFQGVHFGYERLASRASHRRAVVRIHDQAWLVVDDVFGIGHERVRLFWHLLDAPYRAGDRTVTLTTPEGDVGLSIVADESARFGVARGQVEPFALGWASLRYGEKQPAPTAWLELATALPQRMITLVSLGAPAIPAFNPASGIVAWQSPAGGDPCEAQLGPLVAGDAPVVRKLKIGEQLVTFSPEISASAPDQSPSSRAATVAH